MIGLINVSINAFVVEAFGQEAWAKIVEDSGTTSTDWITTCPYPDSITYELVISAANLLGISVNQALEAYGLYFVEFITRHNYIQLLRCLGSNLAELLQNLNNLHQHLSISYPAAATPYFRVENVSVDSTWLLSSPAVIRASI